MTESKKTAAKKTKHKKFPHAAKAVAHLTSVDRKLASIIAEVGPVTISIDPERSLFEAMVSSIVYQQLHGKAAATILARFVALFGLAEGEFPLPTAIVVVSDEQLRAAGLSRAKMLAIQDLSAKVIEGKIPDLAAAAKMDEDELIEVLTQVRGVGVWTAHMLMIFTLGRGDVLPVGDYGVRKGFASLYGKKAMPTPAELQKFARKWQPYRSVAAWYLWRVLELPRFKSWKPTQG